MTIVQKLQWAGLETIVVRSRARSKTPFHLQPGLSTGAELRRVRARPRGCASRRPRTTLTLISRRWLRRCREFGLRWDWRRLHALRMTVHAAGSIEACQTEAQVWFEELYDR